MNPAQPPTEDLSARFDGETIAAPPSDSAFGPPPQLRAAASSTVASTTDEAQHLQDWQALGDDLRALPVTPVNLLPGVMQAIGSPAADGTEDSCTIPSTDLRPSKIAAQPSRAQSPAHTALAERSRPDRARSDRARSDRARSDRARLATLVTGLTLLGCVAIMSLLPVLSMSQMTALAAIDVDTLAEELSRCDVVLVKVPQAELRGSVLDATLTDDLLGGNTLNGEPGLPLRGVERPGDEMFEDLANYERVTNPAFIGDMTREELLAKVLESVETPSLAEEHFGEMIVLFPSDLLREIQSEAYGGTLVARQGAPDGSSPTSQAARSSAGGSASPSTNTPVEGETPRRRKVFVVLRTAPGATEPGPGAAQPGASWQPEQDPRRMIWRYTGV